MIHAEAKGTGVDVNLSGETVDVLREITCTIYGFAASLSEATGDSKVETGSWIMAKLTEGVAAQIREKNRS